MKYIFQLIRVTSNYTNHIFQPREVLMDLSSKFYTHCPHDFGRMVPPVLDNDSIVQQKKEVMLTLSDIELTQSLQKEKVCHMLCLCS